MTQSATQGTPRESVFDVNVEKLARVYAHAILEAAGDHQAQGGMVSELKAIVTDVLDKHPQFEQVLASALVSEEEKLSILDRVFQGKLSHKALSSLKVMAGHNRLGILRQVVRSADQLWENRSNRLPVEIRLACETSPELLQEMTDRLRKYFDAEPIVKTVVDPELIAGFVVRVGDRVMDASARTNLEHARKAMIAHSIEAIQNRPEKFRQET